MEALTTLTQQLATVNEQQQPMITDAAAGGTAAVSSTTSAAAQETREAVVGGLLRELSAARSAHAVAASESEAGRRSIAALTAEKERLVAQLSDEAVRD